MRLKSTLWALAFACAAVSCSDDLEDGPNGNNNNGEMGEAAAYLKVVVNSDMTTKAATDAEEPGSHEEYEVKDVTIVLFNNGDGNTSDYTFSATSDIKGVGFSTVGKMEGGSIDNHSFMAQIEVPVSDPELKLTGKKYGVIAVTNLGGSKDKPNDLYSKIKGGENITQIKKGKDLADYMISYDSYVTNGFVMSTHAMKWPKGSGEESTVTFESDPDNENNAPTVNVYVERLAAKIRVKESETKGPGFFYSINAKDGSNAVIAKVALNNVAIVNQLSGGSYLLKRVSKTISEDEDIVATDAVEYLGEEVWNMKSDVLEEVNYVMDPWFFTKNESASMPTTPELKYENHYGVKSGESMNSSSIGTLFGNYKDAISLPGKPDENGALHLAYVMENTTKVGTSLQGYATGAVFKATYYPAKWSQVEENGSVKENDVVYSDKELDKIDKTATGVDFYRYDAKIFENYDAIFAYYLLEHGHFGDEGEKAECNYTDFVGEEFKKLKLSDFHDHFYTDEEAEHDPFGYLDYLHKLSKAAGNESADTFADIESAKDFKQFMTGNSNTSFDEVDKFTKGECYYTYWIKHQNNNNSQKTVPMENSIVRNNIYDLTVNGINGLGFARSMVPDPQDPTEDGRQLLNVELHVKNWLVRKSNSDIIL